MKIAVSVFTFICFVLLAYHVAATLGTGDLFGFAYKGQDVSLSTFLGIAVATVAGTLLGNVYAYLAKDEANNSAWWDTIYDAFKSPRFGMSMMVSPLVVFVVFDQIDLKHADFGVALFCLQSGFFWDRTFDVLAKGVTGGNKRVGRSAAGAGSNS
jgi:hypothetical protein